MTTVKSELNNLAVYVHPTCKGKLEPSKDALRCGVCKSTYPLLAGIPDFLLKDSEQAISPLNRTLMETVVRLYETPLWYAPILKLAGGKDAPSYGEVIRQMVGLMDIHQGMLLDVACGPGTWGRRLASPTIKVYGIDINWAMLRQGARVSANGGHRYPFVAGVLLSAENPFFLLWWATICAGLVGHALEFDPGGLLAMAVTHWLCDFGWSYFLSALSFKGGAFFGQRFQQAIFLFCGVFLLFWGGKYVVEGVAGLLARG